MNGHPATLLTESTSSDVEELDDPISDGDDKALITDGEDSSEQLDWNNDVTREDGHHQRPHYCGCFSFHPKWLQVFANKKVFTFLLFLFALIEGSVVSGFTSVVLSTLEKRYEFTSTAVGFVAVSYDTVAIFSALIVSYIGGRPTSHKPRWLGMSIATIGIGAFIFASPQFLFGSYKAGPVTMLNVSLEQCGDGRNITDDCSPSNDIAYAVFLLGNFFVAFGAAALYTLGPAFIDEIVLPRYVPLHIGVYQIGALVGPAIGYGLGSAFLTVYVDPWERTNLKPSDPAWVGAWWMAFVFAGIMCFLSSIPFLMYPKSLPDSHIVKQARETELIVKNTSMSGKGLLDGLKGFAVQMKRLLTNGPFMFQSFSLAILFIVVTGMVSFGPQYFEVQFKFSASTAGIIAGGVGIFSAGTGVLTGAIVIFFTKWRGRKLAAFITTILGLMVLFTPAFLLSCPNVKVAGVTTPYANGSISDGIDGASCNSGCGCTSSVYEPVCGADGITYFSPCRAGCTAHLEGDKNVFSQCSCVAENLHNESFSTKSYTTVPARNSTAVDGICDTNCMLVFMVFFTVVLLTFFIAFMAHIPVIYFTIRVVSDDERSFALGLQSSIGRIFGSIPGPLLFGAVFDAACLKWQGACGRRGNCWIYDNKLLSRGALYIGLPCVFVAALLAFLACISHPKVSEDTKTSSKSHTETL